MHLQSFPYSPIIPLFFLFLGSVFCPNKSFAELDHNRADTEASLSKGQVTSILPRSLTSDTDNAASSNTTPNVAADDRDLSWLAKLNPSQFPVRWEDRVVRFLEHYKENSRGRTVMKALLERKNRFEPLMVKILQEMELPEDLIYVSMVESGFDPLAKSPRGAAGLWQFVSRTGKGYGLEQNHWKDERLDPVKATRAAATYLKMLYQKFGSWELTFAAYNMGHGALLQSIRKYNTNNFWVLARLEAALPFETVNYVSKILACAVIGHNQQLLGFDNLELDEAWKVSEVKVPGGASTKALARAAKISQETLQTFNPELRRNRTPPEKFYTLRLPAEALVSFSEKWPKMHPKQTAYAPHVFLFGQSLSNIAKQYRISTQKLLSINEIENPEDIEPGVSLLVPVQNLTKLKTPTAKSSNDEKPVVPIPRSRFVYEDRTRVFFEIQEQHTLADIEQFFQVKESEILRWNHLDPKAKLQTAMVLQLFVPKEVDLSHALHLAENEVEDVPIGSKGFFELHEKEKGRERVAYTISAGDTLSSIAKQFEVSVGDLMRINQIGKNALLQVGQKLFIYREIQP